MFRTLTLLLAVAAAPSPSATDVLKARDTQIRKSVQDPGERSRQELQAAVMKMVDTEAIARAALGKTWDGQPKAEQRRFLKALDSRLRQSITQQIDFYNSSKIDYGAEKQVGDSTEVPTSMTSKGDTTEVDYRLRKEAGGWRIVDIVIDGASTTESYRSSFAKVIAKEGWSGLVARLEKKPAAQASK